MKILIATTLNRNMTEAKIKPLVRLPEVEHIFYVSDGPGPYFEKVKYYCVPGSISRLFRGNNIIRAIVKFFIIFYLSMIKRPDLLMGYSFMPHGISVTMIGKLLHIPSVINITGGLREIKKGGFKRFNNIFIRTLKKNSSFLERMFLKIIQGCNFITVTGSVSRDFLISRGIDKNKIGILPSAIDTKRFFPVSSRKKYDVITVAELNPIKRIDVFLEVISRLAKNIPDIKALILGDGPFRKSLENLSKRFGLEDKVEFASFTSDVERHINEAKIFLLPSKSEGLSLAMLEAMACGVTPVVSDVGDLKDAVKNTVNGRLLDKDDINGFTSSVFELLRNSKTRELYSRRATEAIKRGFTVEIASYKWKRILSGIASDKKRPVWFLERLKAMSIREVFYRLSCNARLKILWLRSSMLSRRGHLSSSSYKGNGVRFYIDKKDLDFIRKIFVKQYYSGAYQIDSIDWYKEYVLSLESCKKFKNDIKRRSGFCKKEVKDVLELNRFQWLVGYAQKYFFTKQEGLARKIVYILRDWIEKNPVLSGENWSDSLEGSLRLLAWAWVYFLIKDSASFDKDFENAFLRSIYFHINFIESNLSRYSSANNHLIGEATALFVTGVLFPQLKGAERRLDKGRFILEREIKKQVYSDGVSKEQSVSYHEFITELYLLAIIIGRKNKIKFSKDLYSRLEKMCEFLINMMDEKGNALSIGDSDGSSTVRLDIFEKQNRAVSILNMASVLFKRPDFKKRKDNIDEKSLWLLGEEGYKSYSFLKPNNDLPASRGFLEGGYYIMRHKDLFLGFDCGKLGYLSLAAHGHADALSIILNVADKNILVDPGTYLYHSGGMWRDYFRSTMAHNTVRIDRLDQSEIKGPFLWGHKAESHLKYWSPNGGYDKVCGYHTGYARLKDPVMHSREVIFDKLNGMITLKDSFCSRKRHFAEMFFHLHPDCSFKKLDKNSYEIKNGDVVVRMELDKDVNAYISEGQEYPICGWYSERFGEKVKAPAVCAENYFEGNKNLITKISVRYKK